MNAEIWLAIVLGFLGGFVFACLLLIGLVKAIVKKVSISSHEDDK